MKKILCGIALLGASATAQAQISAGTTLFSGSIGYSSQKTETSSTFPNSVNRGSKNEQFDFSPSVGYFLADNLALGVSAGATLNRERTDDYRDPNGNYYVMGTDRKTRALTGGVFARYYKFVGDKVALYGQLGGGYQNVYYSGYQNGLNYNYSNRLQGFYANLTPGIVFFPIDKLGLELTLRGASYTRLTDKDENGRYEGRSTNSSFEFGFGLSDFRLGASFYLGR
ncbi:outer membrane beta-barrel protein [Hymenobacter sp. DG01]|uniref:outer membrane beta-barrel protein n=1 Tax=Hymenobacter sp. DG01 TaxID=2584940 RepID=UPI00111E2ED2|nr:outer membrane beta-barrel protein [Hymenobacter sp. DG01]